MGRDYAALPGVGLTEIYPVGVLHSLQIIGRALTVAAIPHRNRMPIIRREVRKQIRYLTGQARARNWRAVRNSFNGYLAEPYFIPVGMRRCGAGWSQKRAIRDLLRHYEETRVVARAYLGEASDG